MRPCRSPGIQARCGLGGTCAFLPTGLMMTAVSVSAIAACFCSIVKSGLSHSWARFAIAPPGLLASFILPPFALQFRLASFHPRQRREIPFSGICALPHSVALIPRSAPEGPPVPALSATGERRPVSGTDFLLLRDHQCLDVLFDRSGEPRYAAAPSVALGRAPVKFRWWSAVLIVAASAVHLRLAFPAPHERGQHVRRAVPFPIAPSRDGPGRSGFHFAVTASYSSSVRIGSHCPRTLFPSGP